MSSFNPIMRDEPYVNGIFPTIPSIPNGTSVLLTGGRFPPVLVNSNLSVRQIRNGKYSRQVDISTTVHSVDVNLSVPSRDDPYKFEIRVAVDVWVVDPIVFFQSKTADVVLALKQCFFADVRKVASNCPLMKYKTLDEDIFHRLQQSKDVITDMQLGIAYRVKDVASQPDKDGMAKVSEITEINMNVEVETHKASVTERLSDINIDTAIMADVASGKRTLADALLEIEYQHSAHGRRKLDDAQTFIDFINRQRKDGHYTDAQAAELVNNLLQAQKIVGSLPEQTGDHTENTNENDPIIDDLYAGKEA